MLIRQLKSHIETSPKNSDTSAISAAILKLAPIRIASTIIFTVFFFFMILTAIFPTAQSYFYSSLWAFSALADLATLNNFSPSLLQDNPKVSAESDA
jgi:hypothetical protein